MCKQLRVITILCLSFYICIPLLHEAHGMQPVGLRIDLEGQVDKTAFPNITFRFRITDDQGQSTAALPEGEVVILEDGQEVHRLQPQRLQREPMAVVLVIDTSGSMLLPTERAELIRIAKKNRRLLDEKSTWRTKMDEAKRAARRFFDQLDPATPCGLVLFNDKVWRREPTNADRQELASVVQSTEVEPNGGTAIWDAVGEAVDVVAAADSSRRRAVVLMTDGKDNSSRRRTLNEAIEGARERKARVYTVGLGETTATKLDEFEDIPADLDETALKRLAEQTGGNYYHVQDADKLSSIFQQVAGHLEHSYAVTFRSRRAFHDGTSRGIVIRFGDHVVKEVGYTTHGLITPTCDSRLYLGLLALLGLLLAVPLLARRRRSSADNNS